MVLFRHFVTHIYDLGGQIITQAGSLANTSLPLAATANAAYDANNRLTTWNGQPITYDTQGNMQTNGAKTYTWDARNRLTAIGGATPASFTYDVADRRTTKSTPITSGISAQITFDGANPVLEKQGTTVTGANLTGLGIDSYLTRTDGTTETYPLTDHLGNVIALTDATGNIVTTYVYEPYGATTQTGAASTNPHQYTGRENDGTGLYYYRARYYDPQLMRFISEDPIGLAGGVNSYAYVGGNPVSYTDPLGLLELNLFPGNEAIRGSANLIGSQNRQYIVAGHGDNTGVWNSLNAKLSPTDLANIIREDPAYGNADMVKLISCSTGKGTNSFAQRLADELGKTVMAPTTYVWLYPNSVTFVAIGQNGQLIEPDFSSMGRWRYFASRKK